MPTKIKELLPPPDRTPVVYGYARVSHLDAHIKGDSVNSQHRRIRKYFAAELKPLGAAWGDTFDDGTNVSAYKIPFHARPAGKLILAKLQPGDHLVLDKVDRIWRSMKDFVLLMEYFDKRQIHIHIVNFLGGTIQNSTAMGQMVLKICVLMAELESRIKAERTKEALYVRRKQGRKRPGPKQPPGCIVVIDNSGERPIKRLEWCPATRSVMKELVRLIDEKSMSWSHRFVYERIEILLAHHEGRKPRLVVDIPKQAFWDMYKYEVAYEYLGIKEPCQIPKKKIINEAARQHKRARTIARSFNEVSRIELITPEQLLALD